MEISFLLLVLAAAAALLAARRDRFGIALAGNLRRPGPRALEAWPPAACWRDSC